MKELSIEEKAKAYDEAIEKFDVILNLDIVKESGTIFADDIRKIFPELKESEDERIRNVLVNYFKRYKEQGTCGAETFNGIPTDNIIAWLEKQGQVKDSAISQHENKMCKENDDSLTNLELKNVEQKPAEDVNLPEFESYLCLMLQKFRTKGMCTNGEIIDYVKEHSQKLRDILVKPTAWSEEDAKGLDDALWCCKQAASIAKDENDMGNVWFAENWLKSLRLKTTWKPSDDEMKAIANALSLAKNCGEESAFDLRTLYEQLKKLREE